MIETAEKVLTATLLRPVRTERLSRRWLGRRWQRFRMALGMLLIRTEHFQTPVDSLPESSWICREFYNIATCSRYPKADTEIVRSLREISPNETEETLTLTLRKQQVSQAVLRTKWSDVGAEIQVSAPAGLLIRLLASQNCQILTS